MFLYHLSIMMDILLFTGNDELEDGDTVMIVTKNTGFTDINDIVR